MKPKPYRRRSRWVALALGLCLLLTACGSTKSAVSSSSNTTTKGSTATTTSSCAAPDTALDATDGKYAGWMQAVIDCRSAHPLTASNGTVTVGIINPQGDPSGSFPDVTDGAEAAISYINKTLGGLGGNPLKGVAGRKIKVDTCFEMLTPSSSTACANQLASEHPAVVFAGYQFFGSDIYSIFKAAGVPVVDFEPISQADFQSPGVYSIAAGGGCVGVQLALEYFSIYMLHAKNLAIPWDNSAPGAFCYHDLQQNPVNIIAGKVKPTPKGVKVVPGATETGYPITAGAPDVSGPAAAILAQKPSAIDLATDSADCFNLIDALYNLGWTESKIPLVMSGSCANSQSITQAGSKIDGVYFIGGGYNLLQASSATGLPSQEISILLKQEKLDAPSQAPTAEEGAMFQTVMSTWIALQNSSAATSPTGANIGSTLAATSNLHMFAGLEWGCQQAPVNYGSVCASEVSAQQWTGSTYKNVGPPFNVSYVVSGTPIRATGPN